MAQRVLVHTALGLNSGYGRTGINLLRALVRRGFEVSVEVERVVTPLPADVAALLTVEPRAPFDYYISSMPTFLTGIPRTWGEERRAYRTAVWTMWEYSEFPEDTRADVTRRLSQFDNILVWDSLSKTAVETLGLDVPVKVVAGASEVDFWTAETPNERDWDSPTLVVGMAGLMSSRKDPYVAMRAVQRLKDEGVDIELRIKHHGHEFPPHTFDFFTATTPYAATWTDEQMRAFYRDLHVYVAPSWGEGLNLPAAEAGMSGAALLLSDVPGHRSWAGLGDGAEFLPVVKGRVDEGMEHARVEEDVLVEALRRLAQDRQYAKRLGSSARRSIPSVVSFDRALDTMLAAMN